MSRNRRRTAPVSNLDGLIVLTLGVVSFVGMCALINLVGLTGDLLWVGALLVVTVFATVVGVAMRVTNRLAWHRQAMRHAAAVNAGR